MKTTLLAILFLLPWTLRATDDSAPVEIEIVDQSPAQGTESFMYRLKERIRASKGLRLTSANTAHLRLIIVTLQTSPGVFAISETWVQKIPGVNFQPFVTCSVGVIGIANTDATIDYILGITEKQGSALRKYWNDPANQVNP